MQRPDACADELVRAVKDLRFVGTLINGTTEGRFLDHPSYDGLLAAAVELDVPIYIHPHLPPEPVRQAYYSDLQPGAGRVLESAAWGWHSETAIHVLRMVLAGTLDRHPRLRLVIGHMGEAVHFWLWRLNFMNTRAQKTNRAPKTSPFSPATLAYCCVPGPASMTAWNFCPKIVTSAGCVRSWPKFAPTCSPAKPPAVISVTPCCCRGRKVPTL